MGAIATRLSDFVIITSDNPRSEKPLAIIRDIEAGAVRKNYVIEPDRREAIRKRSKWQRKVISSLLQAKDMRIIRK